MSGKTFQNENSNGCLIILLVLFAVFGLVILIFYLNDLAKQNPREYATLTSLCQRRNFPDRNAPDNIEGLPKFVVLENQGTTLHYWHNRLHDDGFQAKNSEEAGFVVCITPYETKIQLCRYTSGGTVTQYRLDYHILVFTPRGDEIASHTFEGDPPQECPKSITARRVTDARRNTDAKMVGDAPSYSGFVKWLTSQIISKL